VRSRMRASRWAVLVAALIVAGILGLAVGTIRLSPAQVWDGLRGVGDAAFVVRGLRLPRVILAALVGAGLGMSGGALQGVMRNPLAEPYLLGVSGGAAVGAVLAVSAGLAAVFVPLAAFVRAIVAVVAAFMV